MHVITNSLWQSSEIDIIISLTIKNRPTTITKYEEYREVRHLIKTAPPLT